MKFRSLFLVILTLSGVFFHSISAGAQDIKFESLGNQFTAFYEQADPFDSSKKNFLFFYKGDFVFKCQQISFGKRSTYDYDGFSFNADIALKIDDNEPFEGRGKYSTYQFGSDMVNDARMYSARITSDVVQQLKAGNTLQASGRFGGGGWSPFKVSLKGFTHAYNKVCN